MGLLPIPAPKLTHTDPTWSVFLGFFGEVQAMASW